jgi:membrane fusion protein (multidrug efflux system)
VRAVLDEGVATTAILAPQQGITRDPKGNATAMVFCAGDKVEVRTLVADRAIGDRWLVTSGLGAGDRLVVEGLNKIFPGAQVHPNEVALAAPGSAAPAPAAPSAGGSPASATGSSAPPAAGSGAGSASGEPTSSGSGAAPRSAGAGR